MAFSKEYLSALKDLLVFHKIISDSFNLTNRNYTNKVVEFQEKVNIYADGIIGPETLWELQFPYAQSSDKLLWVRCEADKIRNVDGFDNFVLREDAALKYNQLRSEILDLGGKITSSGGKRQLHAAVSRHRSAKSMHYVGLALDLSITSGFFSPKKDQFVVVKNEDDDADSYWTIYCRADGGSRETLKATYWDGWSSGKDKTVTVEGNFINFTEMAKAHGFYPISPRRSYLRSTNKQYLSSEWWHFQANDLLVPKFSQFGIELLKIEGYEPNVIKMKSQRIWDVRKSIFRKNWW